LVKREDVKKRLTKMEWEEDVMSKEDKA
jgi:hypothetical protein